MLLVDDELLELVLDDELLEDELLEDELDADDEEDALPLLEELEDEPPEELEELLLEGKSPTPGSKVPLLPPHAVIMVTLTSRINAGLTTFKNEYI